MFEPKERVEILGVSSIKKRAKYPVEGNSVIIERGKRGKGHTGWKPQYDEACFLYYHVRFLFWKLLKRKLMVKEGAEKCITLTGGKDTPEDIPVYDRKAAQRLFEAETVKHAGASTQRVEVPTMLWILVAANLVFGLVQLYLFARKLGI